MIYLDNNATTPIAPEVAEAMRPFIDGEFGNPSSAHAAGRVPREAIELAREQVAALIGADASNIVFTSGGTESDNWAIRGALAAQPEKRHIVTTRVEHEAVRKLCELLERETYEVTWLDVDSEGALDLDQLRSSLRADTAVVSVMAANNETGILFPINAVGEIVKQGSEALFHVDAVNAAGKCELITGGTIDLLALSAHKFYGPKGVGALYIRDGVDLPSIAVGGGQERGRRAGTEAVHQLVGMGAAADAVRDLSMLKRVEFLRDKLEREILERVANATVNGTTDSRKRLPNTSNISFENINGEAILAKLDAAGICVSTGSACNSADHTPSPVLKAMNVPYSRTLGSIRFSLGRFNTEDEISRAVVEVERVIDELRMVAGVA